MFKELVDKAFELEAKGAMNPVGYSRYNSEKIKWVVHLGPEKDNIYIQEYDGENRPRPISPRTNNVYAYPFSDEAGYVLGTEKDKSGNKDSRASKKHEDYLKLLEEMLRSPCFSRENLKEAISVIINRLSDGSIKKEFESKEVINKDWITFVYEKDGLSQKYLHEIDETKQFWSLKLSSDFSSQAKCQCSICGNDTFIAANMMTKINLLGGKRPIASYNETAFVSYRFNIEKAPLGICLSCAERSAQTLNFLLDKNSRNIYLDKTSSGKIRKDSARNLTAVYWLKKEISFSAKGQEIDFTDLCKVPLEIPKSIPVKTTESLINDFLISPWTGQNATLNLNDNKFHLAVLSPNGPGRMAVREWLQLGAGKIKENLVTYFMATRLVDVHNIENHSYTVQQLLEPLGEADPNMSKDLIRTIYMGEQLPYSLFQTAVRRLRISGAREGNLDADQKGKKKRKGQSAGEVWQRLCTIIKLYLTYRKEDAEIMARLNQERGDLAYQSGRLLAVLEEIQRRSATSRLSSTLVERYYGSASTSPHMIFPMLVNMATKAHMPKIRKKNKGYAGLESLLEEILSKVDDEGGFPTTLVLAQQGEFALGFYHQRAALKEYEQERLKNLKGENANGSLS